MQKPQAPRRRAPVTETADGYWTGAHTKHRLRFHLVWVPKYRRRVLTEPVAARLGRLLRQACEVNGWGLPELNVQPDHVHLLIQVSPTDSIMNVVQFLKGGTSKVLRAEFPDLVEYLWGDSFWGDSFWSDGYFAESVGQTEEAVLRAYIQNQGLPRRYPRPKRTRPESRPV